MKPIMIALAAALAFGVAGSAAAHPGEESEEYGQQNDWNDDVGDYDAFQRQYAHIMDGIRHGASDGSYTRYQAENFYRDLQSIRYQAYSGARQGNYNSYYIARRLEQLHRRMHDAHERGHDRLNRYYNNDDGYGSVNDYNGYYRQR